MDLGIIMFMKILVKMNLLITAGKQSYLSSCYVHRIMLESLCALSCLIYLLESKEIGGVFPVAQTSLVALTIKHLLTKQETWV